MNTSKSNTWLLFFLIFSGVIGKGQISSTLHFLPAPSQNRISENASRCAIKDSKGFIWVGTIDGLNRYDGYRFHIYQKDSRDSNSISGNYITCIQEDSRGNLWVGTNSGLNLYHSALDGFEHFMLPGREGQNLTNSSITQITVDKNEKLWVASFGSLGQFDYATKAFLPVPVDTTGRKNALLHEDVTALSAANDEGFWIGYSNGRLSRRAGENLVHYPEVHIGDAIVDLLEDSTGHLWIGANNGIYRFDPRTKKVTKYLNDKSWGMYIIDNKVWINVNFKGIYEWNTLNQNLKPVPVFLDDQPIYGDIKVFFKDERNIIWGSYHGLFKQDVYEKRFRWIRHEKGNPNGISEAFVSGIAEDHKGNWVVLTISGGLNYFDRKLGTWLNFKTHPWYNNKLKDCRLTYLKVFGHLAFVMGREAIYEFNLQTGALREYPFPKNGINGLNKSMTKAGMHTYWLSSNRLYLLNTKTGVFEDLTPLDSSIVDSGWFLHQESDGKTWAFSGNRIYEIELNANKPVQKYQYGDAETMFEEGIISCNRDSTGRFWIGRRNGLEYFDPVKGTFQHYSIADGLPSSSINSILVDDKNHIWLGTNNGLSKFNLETGIFRNYDRHDGIQDEIFLSNAAFKNHEGQLYFGGVNGFNVFAPDAVAIDNPYPPKIIIQDFKIFNESVIPGPNAVLSQPISETKNLELSYKHSTISFELLAIGYSQPEKNQYAYKMEGVDPTWNYAGTRHTASYTGLPKGEELLFKVKAANHDGVWNEQPVMLKIYIRPPFWETGWFRLALIGFLLGLALFYYRWRIRSIKLRNLWLEREVSQQTKEIKQQAVNLKQANEELREQAATIKNQILQLDQLYKAQSHFFTSLSHEFRTPLTLLLGNLEELYNAEVTEDVIEKITARMQMSTEQLLLLVNQLMDTAKLESGRYQLGVTKGDILGEVRNIFTSFQVLADKKGLELVMVNHLPGLYNCWFDQDVLFKVLNNLTSNAIKFTTEGKVELLVKQGGNLKEKQQVYFELSDTGIGISTKELPHIFDRFYQVEDSLSARKKGTGIGLSLVKQLIELHHGKIEVESEVGKGTVFRFWLPVSESAFSATEKSFAKVDSETGFGDWRKDGLSAPVPASITGLTPKKDAALLLVAEDNPEIRSFIVRQLKKEYQIIEAANGTDAYKMAIKQVPDLIVSDVIMPGLNGFELCHKVKTDQRCSHIPFILLTALAEQEKKMEGLKRGADAYLSKPFSKEELSLRVANLIRQRENLKQRFLKEYSLEILPNGIDQLEQSFLKKLHELIEANLMNEEFGVEHLMKFLGLSRTQLFRKLKSLTGMSATEFIRDYRLRKAFHLLNENDHTVSEVIYTTGFNSRSYFYDSFKKKFGITPSELKKS